MADDWQLFKLRSILPINIRSKEARCKASQFYSLSLGKAVASMYKPIFFLGKAGLITDLLILIFINQ